MTIRVGDINKTIRLATGFDMSSQTSLPIDFTKPDGSVLTVSGVLGTVAITDDDLGPLAANEYVNYSTVAGDIDQVGIWRACVTYIDAGPSNYPSKTTTFTVEAGC